MPINAPDMARAHAAASGEVVPASRIDLAAKITGIILYKAYTNLLEAQAMAYNFAVVPRRHRDQPRVYWNLTFYDNAYNLGTPIQDFRYGAMFLDGSRTYHLSGRIGDAKLLLTQVHSHLLGDPRSEEVGNYDFGDFELGPDGSFDVVISADEQPGNWIRLVPESRYNFLLIRAIMADWNDELPSLAVDATTPTPPTEDPDESAAEALSAAAHFAKYLIEVYIVGLYDIYLQRAGGQKNQWVKMPGKDVATSLVGSQSTTYVPGVYEMAAGEAIVIEWTPPESDYWSVQLGDVWSRPLDSMHHQTDINMARAAIDSDGKFRAVVTLDDPGVANWLDPTGNLQGVIVMRNYRSRSATVEPSLVKIKADELADYLPADTPAVTPEERRKALAYRRSAMQSFFLR